MRQKGRERKEGERLQKAVAEQGVTDNLMSKGWNSMFAKADGFKANTHKRQFMLKCTADILI